MADKYLRGIRRERAQERAREMYQTHEIIVNNDQVEQIDAHEADGGGIWVRAWVRVTTDPDETFEH